MTVREILILLDGATKAQAIGLIHGSWYHDGLVALLIKNLQSEGI